MNRAPYTDDFICRIHGRPGSHPDEATCSATLFKPIEEVQSPSSDVVDQAATAAVSGRRYRKRPEPVEVKAVAIGGLMMVNNGNGPEYPVPRDMFFATYEEIEPEHDPQHVEGPLDRVIAKIDHAFDEPGVDQGEGHQ